MGVADMQTISHGSRGLWLLVELNLDRIMTVGTLVAALAIGGMIV
jgi:hypothetical protein